MRRTIAALTLDLDQERPRLLTDDVVTTLIIALEDIMTGSDGRILFSAIAVFVALAGIGVSIRGLLFDEPSFFRYGVAGVVGGVACFVWLLNSARDGNS
ncbi:DUF2964 family protein [Paraburkholderia sp. RCC_158]|uniref:DUF2964 family protein n=1 Tax=Paraburkholderia sp. RCC_158 TaxID=3239220 RepID=UPI003523AE44